MTRAKFKVTQVQPFSSVEPTGGSVTLTPVYSTDPNHENKKFWDATPSGEIRLGINNPDAFKQFQKDKEYYVDFTEAPETVV